MQALPWYAPSGPNDDYNFAPQFVNETMSEILGDVSNENVAEITRQQLMASLVNIPAPSEISSFALGKLVL